MSNKIKVLVCGARFGQFYMEAMKGNARYELIGILARGSVLAQESAKRYKATLYTDLEKLPDQIDIVCVAVKTGVLGGMGTELALYFLKRGISVVLEQPVHYQDLMECYRMARKNHAAFHVGNLYLNLPQVKRFLALSRLIGQGQKILYINADMATQVSYPFVHILIQLLGKAGRLAKDTPKQQEGIFQNLSMRWDETFVQVRAQNQEGNQVADNCMHLLFQITLGVNAGSLVLTDANGLLLWRERMEIPDIQFVPGDLSTSEIFPMGEAVTQLVSGTKETYGDLLSKVWVQAVREDMDSLLRMMNAPDGDRQMAKEGALELAAAQSWKGFMQAIGYPVKLSETDFNKICFSRLFSDYRSQACMSERYMLLSAQEVKEAVSQINKASLLSILKYLQGKGFFLQKEQQISGRELINHLPMDKKFDFVIERWLSVLVQNKYIAKAGEYYCCTRLPISEKELRRQWEIALRFWRECLGPESVGQYLYTSAMSLEGQLQGTVKANYLLYPNGRNDIANDLYRNTMIAWYMNQKIAQGVSESIITRKGIRILEVGAGTGATSDVVVKSIIDNGLEERLEEYCYTDLSPYFLVEARERYENAPWLVTKEVDINTSLPEQGIEAHAYDVIIAAGVINNADDTIRTLKHISHCLKTEGTLYMSEAVGEAIQMLISQVFMMQKAKDAREIVNQTFLSQKMWLEVFEKAGFLLVDRIPQVEHKLYALEQCLFILKQQ